MSQAVVRRLNDYEDGDGGTMVPFDAYSASEMAVRLEDLASRMTVVQEFFNRVMVKDQDYGVIPGTDKPALLKPGAEKLCELYGYAPMVKHVEEERDVHSGFYHCRVTVALISKKTGESVAEGTGSANTHESRYRWRWVWADKVPRGLDKDSLTSRTVGRNSTVQYRLENDDPWSLWNTVLKMAKKRALVDVALSATRSSGLFTQDPEAFEDYVEGGGEGAPPIKQPTRKSQRNSPPPDEPEIDSPPWTSDELAALLTEHAMSMRDLVAVCGAGVADKKTAAHAITAWLIANPGKGLRDLINAAIDANTSAAPVEQPEDAQPALIG